MLDGGHQILCVLWLKKVSKTALVLAVDPRCCKRCFVRSTCPFSRQQSYFIYEPIKTSAVSSRDGAYHNTMTGVGGGSAGAVMCLHS